MFESNKPKWTAKTIRLSEDHLNDIRTISATVDFPIRTEHELLIHIMKTGIKELLRKHISEPVTPYEEKKEEQKAYTLDGPGPEATLDDPPQKELIPKDPTAITEPDGYKPFDPTKTEAHILKGCSDD